MMRGVDTVMNGFSRMVALMTTGLALLLMLAAPAPAQAQPEPAAAEQEAGEHRPGGEVNLVLPNLDLVDVGGYNGRTLLLGGVLVSIGGLLFGLMILRQLKNLPVHKSMAEISDLIYETCKTYLITQGRFLAILEIFIAVIIVLYFGFLSGLQPFRLFIIL